MRQVVYYFISLPIAAKTRGKTGIGLITALERQVMETEDLYRKEYQKAVNGLNRGEGSLEGQKQYRARVEQPHRKSVRQRELEIEKITGEDYELVWYN
jgi:hypothetical protein